MIAAQILLGTLVIAALCGTGYSSNKCESAGNGYCTRHYCKYGNDLETDPKLSDCNDYKNCCRRNKPGYGGYDAKYAPEYAPQYAPEYKSKYAPEYKSKYAPEYKPTYAPAYKPTYAPQYKPKFAP
ncbi:adhesive plaque matrix protein-like [Mytilus trossulus]|uniref:adhesive plaque matrix protein-like n=1 Tax=Mytilus trossulus TaxID=6551 RepID=UPI003006C11F